jgi:hypothetical protein
LLCDGLVAVLVAGGDAVVVALVDVLEVAAFAIAAPPPTSAPVTTRVVSSRLIQSPPLLFDRIRRSAPTVGPA